MWGWFISQSLRESNKFSTVTACDFTFKIPPWIKDEKHKIDYHNANNLFRDSEKKFDIIILRHVLEHSPNPRKLLSDLSKKLKPRGSIIFEVPNFDNHWRKVFGKYNSHLSTTFHQFHFTKKSIKFLGGDKEIVIKYSNLPTLGSSLSNILFVKNNNFNLFSHSFYVIQIFIDQFFRNKAAFLVKIQY